MLNKTNTVIDRIIGKIDNDFNPDTSDWIPRVAAWSIEAMQILKVLPTQRKRVRVKVHDRIAYSECTFDVFGLKVFDANGCELIESKDVKNTCGCGTKVDVKDECGCSSTGGLTEAETSGVHLTPRTIDIVNNPDYNPAPDYMQVETVNAKDYPARYNVRGYSYAEQVPKKTYTVIDENKIEVNFDTDCIIIEFDCVKTAKSNIYGCEVPIIPNNGLLIEAIGCYCMYKMLCRGYKHPVFNLAASQYGTNPYFMWNQMKEEVKRSIIIDAQGEINDNGNWRSAFYNFTFNPRD